MSGPDLSELVDHLTVETNELLDVLDPAPSSAWTTQTPSTGWDVADQISHLAYFDHAATTSILDVVAFGELREEAIRRGVALCDDVAATYRGTEPSVLLDWWRVARAEMVDAMLKAGPSRRVPWYGPDFSVASALTGRIMETWAHGQDIYDALGIAHPMTAALYDVARLCARTRANSFVSRGLPIPDGDVTVVLDAPDGSSWRFGDDAAEAIRGSAVEFCLVATQRRNVSDTGLVAEGDGARSWLDVAQAFAGPPGTGRAPGGVAS
jgi:uncharacterized protein (TIGR03084 family)